MRGAVSLLTFPFKGDEHLFMQHSGDYGREDNFRRCCHIWIVSVKQGSRSYFHLQNRFVYRKNFMIQPHHTRKLVSSDIERNFR